MPIKGLKANKSSIDILNTVWDNASLEYQERIPQATRENLASVRNAFVNYTPLQNEFISTLINQIGMIVIKNMTWENPLRVFKKGRLEFGDTIEEIFVDIAKAQQYTVEPPKNDLGDVFEVTRPKVSTYFHRVNRQNYYPLTIRQAELYKAFQSYAQLDNFISKCFEAIYTGANFDEYILMKQLLTYNQDEGNFYNITVTAPTTEETAKSFAVQARSMSTNLTFLSNKYNSAGVYTATPRDKQVIIIRSDYEAYLSVDILAYAFNMDKTTIGKRIVVVDSFADEETVCLLIDEDMLMIYDTKNEMTEQHNARHLYWNYFYHIWQILSTSRFSNAIRFTTGAVTESVNSIEILPNPVLMPKGTTQTFVALVNASNGASKEVTWSVTGTSEVNADTTIDSNGRLQVSPNEENNELTVTATSVFDTSITANATVSLQPPIIISQSGDQEVSD